MATTEAYYQITPEVHNKLVTLWNQNMETNDMAREVKISLVTVVRYIHANPKDFPKRNKPLPRQLHDEIVGLWNLGYYAEDIATLYGMNQQFVAEYIQKTPECVKR